MKERLPVKKLRILKVETLCGSIRLIFRWTYDILGKIPILSLHSQTIYFAKGNNMAGKFDLKESSNGKFYFNLKASNGQIILSSEMYESRSGAENGIASVQRNAGDDGRYERKTAANGEAFFVLKAGNGETIGRSETYSSSAAMENGIESVKTNAPGAEIAETA